ncbi:hypothetical protein ATANTOWER_011429 [Ataeniobius toweri]|uniref:Uncharacterized protein n=1 Tax=Ataeniobius toweri TaxID=208326 RepID=A0ABU7BSP8_9TELE|nr:hypothetical protein [Ataeniobius toweri]
MCSLPYTRLEKILVYERFKVHLLSCLSLLDEASKEAITINVSLFFPIESTTGSVLLCSFFVSVLFSQIPSLSWQMAAHTEPDSVGCSFLLKEFSSPLLPHACTV